MIRPHTFLGQLARDRAGNTIAIMAAMLIPMAGLAGSAIDAARLYVVKVRLQQACDAGVLAGRKYMTGTGTTLNTAASTQADAFFDNNFVDGWMGTTNTSFTPTKTSASQVSGSAQTTVPMTIMKMFGVASNTMSVTCQARYDVADTDIIFVLDTTGSMACLPADSDSTCSSYVGAAGTNTYTRPSGSGVTNYAGSKGFSVPEKTNSRIAALRAAVLSFWDTFDSVKDPSTNVRYGFVTYASSVNAGEAIQDVIPSALVGSTAGDTANYQSRRVYADYTVSYSDAQNGKTQTQCNAFVATRTPATALTYDTSSGTATQVTNYWNSGNSKCYTRTSTLGPQWQYQQLSFDVSGVVGGSVVTNPTKVRGQTMSWLGCVETPVATPGQTSFSATNPPSEIDPDASPTGASRWIPHLQDLEYVRNGSYTSTATDYTNGDDWLVAPGYGPDAFATYQYGGSRYSTDGDALQKSGAVVCGKPVKRLGVMTRSQVSSFVNAADFVPMGGTYHDTGMIWGARLISPTGPWAADTAAWSGHSAPNRVIIFLTDGDMAPTTSAYSMYGVEGYDRRVTNGTLSDIKDFHNKRFLAACAAARAKNIDIWTVAIDTASSTELQTCATSTSQAKYTTSGTDLGTIFADIAKRLAMLRLSA